MGWDGGRRGVVGAVLVIFEEGAGGGRPVEGREDGDKVGGGDGDGDSDVCSIMTLCNHLLRKMTLIIVFRPVQLSKSGFLYGWNVSDDTICIAGALTSSSVRHLVDRTCSMTILTSTSA